MFYAGEKLIPGSAREKCSNHETGARSVFCLTTGQLVGDSVMLRRDGSHKCHRCMAPRGETVGKMCEETEELQSLKSSSS